MALVLSEEQSMLRDSARGSHQRQGAGVASAAAARRQGRDRIFPRSVEDVRRDGIFRPAGAGKFRRQRSRLRRGRRGDGGDRPHPDAVAVSWHRRARGFRLVARRQRRAKSRVPAEDVGWFAAGGACHRRRRQTSPAADKDAGGAFRQRLQASGRQGLCGRRPHRRSPDRGGPHRGRQPASATG